MVCNDRRLTGVWYDTAAGGNNKLNETADGTKHCDCPTGSLTSPRERKRERARERERARARPDGGATPLSP